MTTTGNHAVVLGASMAGLLAARTLSDFFENVTVVERDLLPDAPAIGGGAAGASRPRPAGARRSGAGRNLPRRPRRAGPRRRKGLQRPRPFGVLLQPQRAHDGAHRLGAEFHCVCGRADRSSSTTSGGRVRATSERHSARRPRCRRADLDAGPPAGHRGPDGGPVQPARSRYLRPIWSSTRRAAARARRHGWTRWATGDRSRTTSSCTSRYSSQWLRMPPDALHEIGLSDRPGTGPADGDGPSWV